MFVDRPRYELSSGAIVPFDCWCKGSGSLSSFPSCPLPPDTILLCPFTFALILTLKALTLILDFNLTPLFPP